MVMPAYRFGYNEFTHTHVGRISVTLGRDNDGVSTREIETSAIDSYSMSGGRAESEPRREFEAAARRTPHLLVVATTEDRTFSMTGNRAVEVTRHTQSIRTPKHPRLEALANFFFGRKVTVLPTGQHLAQRTPVLT